MRMSLWTKEHVSLLQNYFAQKSYLGAGYSSWWVRIYLEDVPWGTSGLSSFFLSATSLSPRYYLLVSVYLITLDHCFEPILSLELQTRIMHPKGNKWIKKRTLRSSKMSPPCKCTPPVHVSQGQVNCWDDLRLCVSLVLIPFALVPRAYVLRKLVPRLSLVPSLSIH